MAHSSRRSKGQSGTRYTPGGLLAGPSFVISRSVSSIAEIEQAIAKLSTLEKAELGEWFDALRNREWDRQIEADSASGALDFLLKEVDDDLAQGRTRPADELLDNG